MSAETATTRDRQHVAFGTLAKRGLAAVLAAVVVNVAVTLIADAAGVAPNLDPLSVGPVALFTALGVVGATITYGVLDRLVTDPDRAFTAVAVVVLVLSWVPDAVFAPTLPGATTAGVVVLGFMHLTTAVVAVVVLTDRYAPAWLD